MLRGPREGQRNELAGCLLGIRIGVATAEGERRGHLLDRGQFQALNDATSML